MTLAPSGEVRVVNRAFQAVEHLRRLDSLDDGSPEADAANLHLPAAIAQVLEAVDWNFARKYSKIYAASGITTHPARPHAFILPADCIRVREIVEPTGLAWERQDRVIAANDAGPILIAYTAQAGDATRWPPNFEAAVVKLLAHYLAPGFTRSANRAEILMTQAQQLMEAAAAAEGREQSEGQAFTDEDGRGDVVGWLSAPIGYRGRW